MPAQRRIADVAQAVPEGEEDVRALNAERELKCLWRNPNYSVLDAVELNLAFKDLRISTVVLSPERMAENGNPMRSGEILIGGESTADDGMVS
ncbi:MAG: hypothetical protein M2R45_03238 [Verrucomicrobia subdivision 3 bacterium]|nr:hypothetical protein [Limisphaerales bacterium]MCS1416099.1 hypothetical protein [Limisphaerales bacterium]